jgi:hypothetical protein
LTRASALEDRKRLGPRQRAALDPRGQRFALEILHHEERTPLGIATEVVDVDDVLVADRIDRTRLLVKALDHLIRSAELEPQDLDRAAPGDLAVLAFEHHAHATLGELALDRVAAQLLADERLVVGDRRRCPAHGDRRVARDRRRECGMTCAGTLMICASASVCSMSAPRASR